MVNRVKKRVSMILLPWVATAALGQDIATEEEQPEIRRYTVEMIIFSYAQSVSAGSEVFVPDEPPPLQLGEDGELLEGGIPDAITGLVQPEEPEPEAIETELQEELEDGDKKYELVMLPEEDFTLLDAAERLDNLGAYTPLVHFGWTQPTYPQEETEALPLSSFITPPDGLEGDLTLYLSRYLHLAVNLQLDAPTEDGADDGVDDTLLLDDFSNSYDDFGDTRVVSYPVRYRIDEDRIFRNGELRYFDHPKFGVLAKISRVEEEETEEFEEELLGFDGE